MRIAFIILAFLLSTPGFLFAASCTKEDVCAMVGTMDHFSILDKCPGAGQFLSECKHVSESGLAELPDPEFVDNGDGTVTDKVNKLMWIKKGILTKSTLKEALEYAQSAKVAGKTEWRLPTLPELKTLMGHQRSTNPSGNKSWINPVFDDDEGHYYWTTTSCSELSFIEDRYQKKTCQEGDKAVWLIHFNINAVFWHHVTAKNYYIWLVRKAG